MDDITGICSSEGEEIRLKTSIKEFYKIKEKDTSKLFKVLGILVTRNTHLGMLKLSQPEYIKTLLERFGMNNCNPIVTPVDKGSHLLNKEDNPYENVREYQALTRSLMYVAMSTCPDIAYITQFLSQFNKTPSHLDWNAGKRVLQYLKGSVNRGIVYRREPETGGVKRDHVTTWGYCDANYTEDSHTSKRVSLLMGSLSE